MHNIPQNNTPGRSETAAHYQQLSTPVSTPVSTSASEAASPPNYQQLQADAQAFCRTMFEATTTRWLNDIQSISDTTRQPVPTVIKELFQRIIEKCHVPANLLTEEAQALPKYEYCEPLWKNWAADIEQDITHKEKVYLLYADFRVLLAEVINSKDQLKPLFARLKDNGWLGQEYRSQSVLTICENYRSKYYPAKRVDIMRIIMKDFLETGVIRDPDVVNSILMLPAEGKLNPEDQRKINLIGEYYRQGVSNGTIGNDHSHSPCRPLPMLEEIFSLLRNTSINPEAQDRFLVYCQHKRLRDGKKSIEVRVPMDGLRMSWVVDDYKRSIGHDNPQWLTYLLQDAISSGFFDDPKKALDKLCAILRVPEPEASIKTTH